MEGRFISERAAVRLRKLIVEWISANSLGPYWLLDVFRHLINHGASADDALAAMSLFVDEAIALKKAGSG
jgi:hypothetical protein